MDTILYGYRFFDDLLIQDWPIFPFCFSIDVKIQPFIVLQYSSSVLLPMMCLLFMCSCVLIVSYAIAIFFCPASIVCHQCQTQV